MSRLTERELNVMDCASYTKCNTDECVGYCGGCNAEEEAKLKLKHYEDLEEQGLLLKKENAVDKGHLYDWYIHSVSDDAPVWTEAHIAELFNDFILIPRTEAEKALEEMKGE